MEKTLSPLPSRTASSVSKRVFGGSEPNSQPNDSALCVLTDFRHAYPITIEANFSVASARAEMQRLKVHAFLVTEASPEGPEQRIVGLITHYDIDKKYPNRSPPMRPPAVSGSLPVSAVMTPWNELSLLDYASLEGKTVLDLLHMFQGTGVTHLLVVEMRPDDSAVVRGLISRSSLSERLQSGRRSIDRLNDPPSSSTERH